VRFSTAYRFEMKTGATKTPALEVGFGPHF
jgi:hypothetical protein